MSALLPSSRVRRSAVVGMVALMTWGAESCGPADPEENNSAVDGKVPSDSQDTQSAAPTCGDEGWLCFADTLYWCSSYGAKPVPKKTCDSPLVCNSSLAQCSPAEGEYACTTVGQVDFEQSCKGSHPSYTMDICSNWLADACPSDGGVEFGYFWDAGYTTWVAAQFDSVPKDVDFLRVSLKASNIDYGDANMELGLDELPLIAVTFTAAGSCDFLHVDITELWADSIFAEIQNDAKVEVTLSSKDMKAMSSGFYLTDLRLLACNFTGRP